MQTATSNSDWLMRFSVIGYDVEFCDTVAYWLERSACNVESKGLTLVRDSYCVGTLTKFFAHNCSARRVSALLNLSVRRAIAKLSCYVLLLYSA